MKTITIIFSLLITLTINANAQVIPNYNFENWTNGANEAPDGWQTHGNNHPGFYNVTRSTEHSLGSYSVKLENKIANGDTTIGVIETTYPGFGEGLGPCFPVSVAYTSLKGYYKYSPQNGDSAQFIAPLFKEGYANPLGYGNILAMGAMNFGAAATFTPFSIPINYFDALTPDSAYILITASRGIDFSNGAHLPTLGNSVLYIDALNYDTYITGINDPMEITRNFSLFPTAGSGDISLSFDTDKSNYTTIKIYDLQGRELKTLYAGTLSQGNHRMQYNISDMQSSEYLLVVANPEGYRTEKIFIAK
jgi:hypothetical protein